MKGLVYVIGSIEDVFFQQEIEYFHEHFDKISVIAIEGNKEKSMEIASKSGVTCHILSNKISIKHMKQILHFYKNLDIQKEIKSKISENNKIKKFAYISLYGLSAILGEAELQEILSYDLSECSEIYAYSFYFSRGAFLLAWARNNNLSFKKIVIRGHRYDLYEDKNKINYLPFRNYILNEIDIVSLISKDGYDYFCNNYPDFKSKARLFYLGTNNKKRLCKCKKDKTDIVFASCSRIIQVKRIDLIITLISKIRSAINKKITWIHLGDGELMEEMQALANRLLTGVDYKFLGKIQNDKILETLLKYDTDYLINMSNSEGLPVSMMEAFSIGIPVIARNVGGVSEIIDDECGILIEEENLEEESIITKILHYVLRRINKPNDYYKESDRCVRKWEEKFNADRNHKKFIIEAML